MQEIPVAWHLIGITPRQNNTNYLLTNAHLLGILNTPVSDADEELAQIIQHRSNVLLACFISLKIPSDVVNHNLTLFQNDIQVLINLVFVQHAEVPHEDPEGQFEEQDGVRIGVRQIDDGFYLFDDGEFGVDVVDQFRFQVGQ